MGAPTGGGKSIWVALPYIVAYWCAAVFVIFMNAGILKSVPYPAMLTAWHQGCSTALVRVVYLMAPGFFDPNTPDLGMKTIFLKFGPISLLFALSLALGNRAFMHISVPLVQMIKAMHPVLSYLIAVVIGTEAFRRSKLQATLIVSVGILITITGELRFVMLGFVCQALSSLAECSRLVLIGQILHKQGLKLDPLTALMYYAPLCFACLLVIIVLTEIPEDWGVWRERLESKVGYGFLFANGIIAFFLNVAVVSLIKQTDPIIYIVVGILKDIFVFAISYFALDTPISSMQVFGFSIAVIGIQIFNCVQKDPDSFEGPKGLVGGIKGILQSWGVARSGFEAVPTNESQVQESSATAIESPAASPEISRAEQLSCLQSVDVVIGKAAMEHCDDANATENLKDGDLDCREERTFGTEGGLELKTQSSSS